MKIEDVKFNNFIRLCKEHGLDPNADQKGCGKKLAQLLNASKQHASQLLLGKSSIGYNTIDKLCKAWTINVIDASNQQIKFKVIQE